MPFFLRSCAANPDIDWLFFSDSERPEDAPDNTRFIRMDFPAYCRNVSAKLDIAFAPINPYKLCDLKPALGFIHAEEIAGYDYWGFGDIDLVYGGLGEFFRAQQLERYAIFSTHARRVSGHLCLMRNGKRMREAFMAVKGWREKLVAPGHLGFDEGAFTHLFIRHKNWHSALRALADRCNPWRRDSRFAEDYSTPGGHLRWHDGSKNFPQRWYWRNGRLTNDRDGEREFPYFHFIAWKFGPWSEAAPKIFAVAKDENFCVTPQGFERLDR